MAMGTRKGREKQEDLWIAHTELATAPGHPFYQRLNELLEATRAYGAALVELGARADSPIVTSRFELASELALNLGGVAKPSGAGGGDVGIALFGDVSAARTFSSRLTQLGMQPIDVGLDSGGVHRRVPTSIG